jgi:DNA-binding winged helix-turn-helix (wHTH) protein/Tol biopolymer transport system component
MALEINGVYRFGPFRISLAERVLWRDGEIVPLTPKAFDTLVELARNAGTVIEKERLIRAVWPDTFVEEGNLAQNIFSLRKALGENPEGTQYIQTIPKRGYRLVVTAVEPAEPRTGWPAESPARRETGTPKRWRRMVPVATGIGLVLAATLVAARWVGRTRESAPSGVRISEVRVANNVAFAALSPEGKHFAYVAMVSGGESLWVRNIAGVDAGVRLESAPIGRYWGITYSPDGQYIYYIFEDESHPVGGVLYRIAASGGEPRELLVKIAGRPVFTPDGTRMVFRRNDESGAGLLTATSLGTEPKLIASSRARYPLYDYGWTADGKTIVYTEGDRDAGQTVWSVREVPVEGGPEIIAMPPQPRSLHSTAWRDSRDFITISPDEETGAAQIWQVRLGQPFRRITNDFTRYEALTVTRDWQQLVATHVQTLDVIWTSPAPGSDETQTVPVTSVTGNYDFPTWTPDGKIVYSRGDSLWLSTADGREQRPLLDTKGVIFESTVSSDGRFVVFVLCRGGVCNLWRIGIGGEGLRQVTYGGEDKHPRFSPDAKSVLYTSRVQGEWGVWMASLENGGPPVKIAGLIDGGPVTSPDGKWFAHLQSAAGRRQIHVRSVGDGSLLRQFDVPLDAYNLGWNSRQGAFEFLRRYYDSPPEFWRQPFSGGPAGRTGDVLPPDAYYIDWSRDGRRIVYIRRQVSRGLVLITGFR